MNSVERINKEATDNNAGDRLEVLTEISDKFDSAKARRLVETEKTKAAETEPSATEIGDNDVLEVKARIGEIFEEGKCSEGDDSVVENAFLQQNGIQPNNVQPDDTQSSISRPKTISDRYELEERSRVDKIKAGLDLFNIHEYERKQIASRPSTVKKAIRLMADRLGIKTKKGEERREREAMYLALNEYREEERAREEAIEEQKRQTAAEQERKRIEREANEARREKEALEYAMSNARDSLDYDKHDRFKKQRVQELVERDLNTHLLKVDNLEVEVAAENPEIQKRLVSFENVDIPVYDLKGTPFSLLSTTVDYRKANTAGQIGTETYKQLLENPSIWAKRRDEAEKEGGFGTRHADARGDTISASYWNSERNIHSHVPGDLIYGFENVQADSIIGIFNGDGGTSNMAGRGETTLSSPDIIKQLEGANGTSNYNEVLLRRYTENGVPKRPDYIIAENGRITEAALRHAKYFDVPIINIERSAYEEKAEKRGEELLASISENDTYEELDAKISELMSISRYRTEYHALEGIGRDRDIPRQIRPTPLQERCLEVSQMELNKRLDFIKDTLEENIRSIKSATENGLSMREKFSGFEFFNVYIENVQKQLRRTEFGDSEDSSYSAPGNCNWIDIQFRLKGSSHNVNTRVYDGKRVYKVEEALASGRIKKEEIENANSSFYDTLEPVVLRYFETVRKNKELS